MWQGERRDYKYTRSWLDTQTDKGLKVGNLTQVEQE